MRACLFCFQIKLALFKTPFGVFGGDKRDRTADPLLAKQVLSQLSYTPISRFKTTFRSFLVGLSGLEPPTSRLSGGRSNLLSYKPIFGFGSFIKPQGRV